MSQYKLKSRRTGSYPSRKYMITSSMIGHLISMSLNFKNISSGKYPVSHHQSCNNDIWTSVFYNLKKHTK